MKLTLTLFDDPKITLLVAERRALQKAYPVALALSKLTCGHEKLTDLHAYTENARDALAAMIIALDLPDATGGHAAVEEAAAKQVAAGPGGKD